MQQHQSVPNPALEALAVLVGEWTIEIVLPGDPGNVVRGRATYAWLEGGAFLVQRSEVDWGGPSGSVAVIGRDDGAETFTMLYFDSRGVSRIYELSLGDGILQMWRTSPGFSQRFIGTIGDGGDTIAARWEKSEDGSRWELDFDLTFTRVK